MARMEGKSLNRPDEVRTFDKGTLEIVNIGGRTVGRATFQPGWKWSNSVKPLVNTKSCEAPPFQYHISGTLRVKMDDGAEKDFKAGDVSLLESGHDAWVIGDEPVVIVDFRHAGLCKRPWKEMKTKSGEAGSSPPCLFSPDFRLWS